MPKNVEVILREYFKTASRNPDNLGLDSLALAALVAFIQNEFNVHIQIDDVLDGGNFKSLAAIKALIERRQKR